MEDNEDDAAIVRKMLDKAPQDKCDLHHVEKLSEGIKFLQSDPIDIVLLDLYLPDSRGHETFSTLQSAFPNLPIVIMTGLDDITLGDRIVQLGAQDYLIKGKFTGDALLRAIRYAIDRNGLKRQLQEAIAEAEAGEVRLKQLISSMSDGVVVVDKEGIVRFANPVAASLFSACPEEMLGIPFRFPTVIGRNDEVEIMREGKPIHLEMSVTALEWRGEKTALATLRDVTEQKQLRDRLIHLSYHDTLTGLANRSLLMVHLKQAIARASRTKKWVAACFGDLDQFKQVNDTLGHPVGDLLLQEAAKRMETCLREGDSIARLGGDEFVILLPDLTRLEDISNVAQKIVNKLSLPYSFDGHEWVTTISLGISVYPDDTKDAETLLKYADMALYRAKESGKNTCHYYSPAIETRVLERRTLEESLRSAILEKRLFVNYQPIVSLRTGQILGLEGLLRLMDLSGEVLLPEQFIPIAEETGLIVSIGEWALHTVCTQNKIWQDMELPPVVTTVNLSARQLKMVSFVCRVANILKETGLPPSYLELELTESMMQDMEQAISGLRALKAMGVRTSVDDFGTGYSSLSHLRRFPLDTLKIDASFICNITSSKEDRALLETIVIMAHNLKLRAVAEGVENEEQLRILRSMGCDAGQGFYFSKPLSTEDTTAWLGQVKSLL